MAQQEVHSPIVKREKNPNVSLLLESQTAGYELLEKMPTALLVSVANG